jgi:hypothetical protein
MHGGSWLHVFGDSLGIMVVFKGLEVWGQGCCFVFFHCLPIIISSV